jgi:hypothetical protein
MREFIGHKVKVAVEVIGVVEGTLVDDRPSMILIKGGDEKITRVLKAKICSFMPIDFEPFKYIPFLVLFCDNKKTSCPGVQYIKEGDGFTKNDVETFVGPCPCRNEDCVMGSKGELRSVSGEFLKTVVSGTMFGEYPEKKEKKSGNAKSGRTATSASSKGEGEVRGVQQGKESSVG